MKNKIIFISSYPEKLKIHGEKTVGGASYTKNLLKNLKKINRNSDIEVLAEIFDKKEIYEENGIVVNRIWKRNSISSLIKLTKYLVKTKSKKIIFSFEVYMFGSLLMNIYFLLMLLILKIARKNTILIIHQVVNELKLLYLPFIFLSDKLIVFEKYFKDILGNRNKIFFVPHAVEKIKFKTAKIKNNLIKNKFKVLFFGYLSPYKGIRELTDIWEQKFGNLIIAGGGNPNHMKNKSYVNFVKNIKATGFVKEKQIPHYFLNSDLVIFPYKKFFSSSGPLSLTFSFEKPFLLSRPLEKYFESPDFAQALKETGLKKEDLIFDLNKKSLEEKLSWARKNLKKLSQFSKIMKEKRSWEKVAKMYIEVIK